MTTSRVFFLAFLISLIYWAPHWMPQSAEKTAPASQEIFPSSKPPQAGSGSATRSADALQRALREAEEQRDSLTPEQRAMFQELKEARGEVSKTRVAEKLLRTLGEKQIQPLSFYDWAADAWLSAQSLYERIRRVAELGLGGVPGVLGAFAWGGRFFCGVLAGAARGWFGFGFSRAWLVIVSFVAIALAMGTRTNPWSTLPAELVLPPIVALVGCAIALRLVDMNYPCGIPSCADAAPR